MEVFTNHAYKRMQERNLLQHYDRITRAIHYVEPILNRYALLLRINGVSVVAVKNPEDQRSKVVTVWKQ